MARAWLPDSCDASAHEALGAVRLATADHRQQDLGFANLVRVYRQQILVNDDEIRVLANGDGAGRVVLAQRVGGIERDELNNTLDTVDGIFVTQKRALHGAEGREGIGVPIAR